jgi:hypothetical protein
LPHLSHNLAKAYAATDAVNTDRKIYGLVLERAIPYRLKMADILSTINNPNLQPVLGHGSVMLSSTKQWHEVIFLEIPQGTSLAEMKAQGKKMHEHQVIDRVLPAMLSALIQLRDKELVHGTINPSTVYLADQTYLSEAVSAPPAYYQNYLYEPLERLMAGQVSRGAGDEKVDVYATAVLAFEMIYGLDHVQKYPQNEFIERALEIGTYHLFTNNLDISDNMADFFRGAMSDNLEERWDVEHFQNWLGGKRYNMITPPAPRDASRSIEFLGKEYYSKRALAHSFHTHWRATMKDIRELRLDRWFEMSMHQPDLANRVERLLRIGGSGSSEKTNVDMLTRLISLLDPTGPIRTPHYSICPEGLGIQLAELFRSGLPNETHEIVDLIDADIPNYWGYLTEHAKSQDLSQVLWRAQRVRPFIKIKSLGFGIERLLYEFNPDLACQSPLVQQFNSLTIPEVLQALDSLAPTHAKEHSLVDRHLIAFLACKLDIGKELKIQDVAPVAALANNQELIALRIIGRAQQKFEKEKYVALATWAAMRVETMLIHIHNRTLREKLIAKLKPAAASGNINEVLSIIINREIINADQAGFEKALSTHKQNQKMITDLSNTKMVGRLSQQLGGRISSIVGYIILVLSLYIIAKTF